MSSQGAQLPRFTPRHAGTKSWREESTGEELRRPHGGCAMAGLHGPFDVRGGRAGLRHLSALLPESLEMIRDRVLHLAFDFLARCTSRDAASRDDAVNKSIASLPTNDPSRGFMWPMSTSSASAGSWGTRCGVAATPPNGHLCW